MLLLSFNKFVLKAPLEDKSATITGTVLSVLGLVIFANGLRMGLLPLGKTVGLHLPKHAPPWLVLAFGFLLGLVVTLAEPSLQALGAEVEELTAGLLRSRTVILAVAFGVGMGVTAGILKIALRIPNTIILIPALVLVGVLTYFAPETVTGLAFDAAGVTTGPVTVPTIIALGVGVASALGGRDPLIDGFGLVALCLIGPMITVLVLGIVAKL